jgi:hypothetical protein
MGGAFGSALLGGPPGWSARAARLPGAQSRNSNWARYRKEISDNTKNSWLAVVLGFGPALHRTRPGAGADRSVRPACGDSDQGAGLRSSDLDRATKTSRPPRGEFRNVSSRR